MQIKVRLPTGDEIAVPHVEPNSTPGHLKENLKYSLRVPPKFIKLVTEDGRVLDDIKPLASEENRVSEGMLIVASVDEEAQKALPADERPAEPKKPTMIRKEEPPKPKKAKKETVCPTVTPEDVVKQEVLKKGSHAWTPKNVEGKASTRQLAFLRVQAMDTKQSFPEDEDDTFQIALGDPRNSPAWLPAVKQLDIGEKAVFQMTYKVIDYNPDGLCPDAETKTWSIELVKIEEVEDIMQDFSQLLYIQTPGNSKDKPEELDQVAVHWRVWRWMPESRPCIGSSRERIALMPGYGLVPIEDPNAPPVTLSVGEGQQMAFELLALRLGTGGQGLLYLHSDALRENRPGGLAIVDIELVAVRPSRGPGTTGYNGWQSVVVERDYGDAWLEKADEHRGRLESYDAMRKTTDHERAAKDHITEQAHKYAENAARRYRRALTWLEKSPSDDKSGTEILKLRLSLARAVAMSHAKFGDDAEQAVSEESKKDLAESMQLLEAVLKEAGDNAKYASIVYESLKIKVQVHYMAHDVKEGRAALAKLNELAKDRSNEDLELKDWDARLNRMDKANALQEGAGELETVQKRLQAAVEAKDQAALLEALGKLDELISGGSVKFKDVTSLKVGKDVGNSMKLGMPEVAAAGRKVVGGIQALAQKNDLGV